MRGSGAVCVSAQTLVQVEWEVLDGKQYGAY